MDESRSTTIASPTPTESSERSSWVDIEWIDPGTLDKAKWARIAELLKPAIDLSPGHDLFDTLRDVKSADASLWGLANCDRELVGVIVCRVLEFPSSYSVLLVDAIATDHTRMSRENLRSLLAHLEDVGRASDVDAVRVSGRAGWGVVFDDYVEISRTFDKVIREES